MRGGGGRGEGGGGRVRKIKVCDYNIRQHEYNWIFVN